MQGPFDPARYRHCCGQTPRFTRDARMWWALCVRCGQTAVAIDGSAEGLAGAWNESMERKEGKEE